jgi:anaerobic ribonucleoside-triphosphate reductase
MVSDDRPALPANVIKRDGQRVDFDLTKIASAVARAGAATGEFDASEALTLAQRAGRVLAHKHTGGTPDIETIQDCVEHTLAAAGWFHTARAYIVYRDRHERLRSDRKTLVDVAASIDEYLEQKDWRVNANANQGYSLGGLILNVSGKVVANYWLSHVYAPEIGRAHREGDVHIHDLDMLAGYCAGWSLRQLLHEGLNGVPGKVEAAPPKHMSSAVGQIVNFLGTLQNEWAGAQAFSSFDTYMAPFVRADAMSYDAVKQCIQELIYNLNVPSRWGTQTPFTNLTFDWVCPEDLRGQIPVIAGREMPFTYGDLQAEMDMINRAYIEVMTAGDDVALFRRLDELLLWARDSLEVKRKVIQRLIDQGLFPYTKRYLGTLRNHFSTIGVNGVNEMIRNFTRDRDDITTPDGHALALKLLDHVRMRIRAFQEETGHMYNLEATPAEGTTYRFAKEDRRRWPGILQAGTPATPYYTNSTQLPVGYTDDPFEALARQEPLQTRYTGGTVLHLYMNERLSSPDACRTLVRRALERFRLPYVTVTPTFSICPTHGYLAGEHEFCPRCDDERLAAKRAAA